MRRERPEPAGHMVVLRVLGVLEREQGLQSVLWPQAQARALSCHSSHLCSSCPILAQFMLLLRMTRGCALLMLSSEQADKPWSEAWSITTGA